MMIKRKNKNYFDVEKEMQFLNEQLNQGYLLTSTSIHAYEFEETSLKGQYYIAYITDEKQKQELDEMADEITEIKNEDFHSVCRMGKQLKNSFYRTDQLKGKWCYYFIPYNFDYCIESDIKRKHEMYKQLFKLRLYILILFFITVLFSIYCSVTKNIPLLAGLYTPWNEIENTFAQGDYFWTYISVTVNIVTCILPLYIPFLCYQCMRLFKLMRY